jgi:protein-glutamine gamma-glutamyltransferase
MINISGNEVTSDAILSQLPQEDIGKKIVETLSASTEVYKYDSMDQLKFELDMRKYIIEESIALYKGRLRFRTFRESECNNDYWDRTDEGGFTLKEGVKPADAINDIFRNTRLYGTECATAIVIIYYKAVLDIYKEGLFNELFPKITLMNWQHTDDLLGIYTYRDLADYLPGDCRYFKNPDVDPLTPEWQGENAIDLGNGTYYGHGIGIRNEEGIINALNKNRISGSEISAYLLKSATRPDFKGLSNKYKPMDTTTQTTRRRAA